MVGPFLWERFNLSEFTRETEFPFRFAIKTGAGDRAEILYTVQLSNRKLFLCRNLKGSAADR
jgi:hypothetical protein